MHFQLDLGYIDKLSAIVLYDLLFSFPLPYYFALTALTAQCVSSVIMYQLCSTGHNKVNESTVKGG